MDWTGREEEMRDTEESQMTPRFGVLHNGPETALFTGMKKKITILKIMMKRG